MNEELINGLRWVLLADSSTWRGELARVLSGVSDPSTLAEVRALLVERLAAAEPAYRQRMQAMIEVMDASADRAGASDDVAFSAAADAWRAADREVERLERDLAAARQALAKAHERLRTMLSPGEGRQAGGVRFERAADRRIARVVDAAAVPPELCRLVPDPALLQRALERSGRAPAGTVLVVEPGSLDAVWMAPG